MAACVICGGDLPAGSRADRITCSDRCCQRKSRSGWRLPTAEEALTLLEQMYPERWAEPAPRDLSTIPADPLDAPLGDLRRAESDLLERLRELAV